MFPNPTESLYHYIAKLIRVIDGDTVVVNLDLGVHTWRKMTLRLARINCLELTGETREKALEVKSFVVSVLPEEFIVHSKKLDSFGRAIAEVFFQNENGNWVNLNDFLVEMELANWRETSHH